MTDFALCAAVVGFFEGFQATAAWDVNAWRLGFGSDTEGPDQVRVHRGMATTRARALQNLAARLPAFEKVVIEDVGETAYAELAPNAQAALISFAYNYGQVTPTIAAHVKALDIPGVADAIAARGVDNAGVNARRRFAEAALVASTETVTYVAKG